MQAQPVGADAIAYVCEHMESLRAVLPDGGSLLLGLAETVRDGGDPTAALDALHDALLAVGDALGVYGHTRSLRPAGVESGPPAENVYLCPVNRCTRHRWPDAAGHPAPRCGITGRPLRREKL